MRVLDAGHRYELAQFDGESSTRILQFVKRNDPPERYPGNTNAYPGTLIQEVIRALIDRIRYVDRQAHWWENKAVLACLHGMLWLLEFRAHRDRGEWLWASPQAVASMQTCSTCGHVRCTKHPTVLQRGAL